MKEKSTSDIYSKQMFNNINFLFYSIFLSLITYNILNDYFKPNGFNTTKILISCLLFGSILLLFFFFYEAKKKVKKLGIEKLLFALILYVSFTILYASNLNNQDFLFLIANINGLIAWITPLGFYLGYCLPIMTIHRFFINLSAAGILFFLIGILFNNIFFLTVSTYFFAGLPWLLLFYDKQDYKNKFVIILATVCFFYSSYLIGARIVLLELAMIICLYCFNKIASRFLSFKARIFLITFFYLLIMFLFYNFGYDWIINNVYEMMDISITSNNLSTDTRTFLYEELFDDMNHTELLLGRGILGKYYSHFFHINPLNPISDFRPTIEVGYLNILLKGGFILYSIFILTITMSIKKGLFIRRYTNYIASVYLITLVFLMFIEKVPQYSVNYLIIWLSVGIAYKDEKCENINSNPSI